MTTDTYSIQQISQVILKGCRDVEQVHNCWNQLWALFKCVCYCQEHTGGGDRDKNASDKSNDEDEDEEIGKKCKKPKKHGKDVSSDGNKEQFMPAQMDSFEVSKFFTLIDLV